jgi:hypothetical protein
MRRRRASSRTRPASPHNLGTSPVVVGSPPPQPPLQLGRPSAFGMLKKGHDRVSALVHAMHEPADPPHHIRLSPAAKVETRRVAPTPPILAVLGIPPRGTSSDARSPALDLSGLGRYPRAQRREFSMPRSMVRQSATKRLVDVLLPFDVALQSVGHGLRLACGIVLVTAGRGERATMSRFP